MATILTGTNPIEDLNIRQEHNVPLGPMTWYGMGGPASCVVHPANVHQLSALAVRCQESGTPVRVLGHGANVLVLDHGFPGVVVRLDDPYFKHFKIDCHVVTVGAGYDLAKLVLETAKAGLGGLQCLAGIPASVGGAVRMNAGGVYGDIGQTVRRVMVCDANGQVYYRDRDDLVFDYRRTNILARYILEVEFDLTPQDPQQLMKQVKEIFTYKKNSQPLAEHSAGCAFKNPRRTLPADVDHRPGPSAGQLIEQSGLKGFRIGRAEVSTRHANFVIAHPGCTAADVMALIDHVQRTVQDRHGLLLEREVVVWP